MQSKDPDELQPMYPDYEIKSVLVPKAGRDILNPIVNTRY